MNFISLEKIRIILMLSLPTLVACSGGGGGGGTLPLSFQPLVGAGTSFPVMEIYNKDLNFDGIDEVVIAGRKTQPATSVDWQNFNIQIFGWNTGSFTNETSTWFSGSDNVIIGTDQAVKFGDFDGDGRIDMITTAATDDTTRSIYARTVVYHQNTAGTFTRTTLAPTTNWQHDLIVYDFNDDGRTDFLATDYGPNTTMGFGNADDTFTLHSTGNAGHSASGLAVADFITGNGTQYGVNSVEIIMSDSGLGASSVDDTKLFTWSVVDPAVAGTLTLTDTGKTFPATSAPNDHGIRALAYDFNGVGGVDVIVFQRPLGAGTTSSIQFLENDGAGNFTTAAGALIGYGGSNPGSNYQPKLISIDAAGQPDIFLSGTDFDGTIDQTQVLVNNDNGTFTATYVSNFTNNWITKHAATPDANTAGQTQQIVLGPSNNYYIITTVLYDVSGTRRAAVYITNIGTNISTGL